ncbi:hypothetical protein [Streptomyces montanus]|nr:hypothetical protein [Streptomyces montanus]
MIRDTFAFTFPTFVTFVLHEPHPAVRAGCLKACPVKCAPLDGLNVAHAT